MRDVAQKMCFDLTKPLSHGACNKPRKPRAIAISLASDRAQKAMNPPSALAPLPIVSAPFPPPPHHCALREKDLAKSLRCAVGYRCGIGQSAEGIKPPSACAL
ncbi:MAG: hypothetical protein WAW10_02635 [Gallionella sp.]